MMSKWSQNSLQISPAWKVINKQYISKSDDASHHYSAIKILSSTFYYVIEALLMKKSYRLDKMSGY